MRIFVSLAVIVSISLLLGCSSSKIPESSLTIRETVSNLLLSTSESTGSLSLALGETRQVRVFRTFRNSNGNTETDDVTQFANYKWPVGSGVATIDQLGNITGVAGGTTHLEIKFRESQFEPWDICRLEIEVQ